MSYEPSLRKKVELILITSKLVLFHADDLLHLQAMQRGNFTPQYHPGSILDAIKEITGLVESTIDEKDITIELKLNNVT